MKYETLLEAVGDYVAYRRELDFDVGNEAPALYRFARYADTTGHKGPITTELALEWATLPQHRQPVYRARRLDILRRFARHMKLFDPETEVPPEGILGPSQYRRRAPHIYSDKGIAALMKAAGCLTPTNGLRPHTYVTLFGLLASSGLRISEALNLLRKDVDIGSGTITIRESKFHKSRIVPLHPTTVEALKSYIARRDKKYPLPKTTAFFVSQWGTSLKYRRVFKTFRRIARGLGWSGEAAQRRPRIHDLRHTFAARRLLEWYRTGEDVHQKLSFLSTYLGHAMVANTYWYLTAIPELMAIAGSRFERFARSEKETHND